MSQSLKENMTHDGMRGCAWWTRVGIMRLLLGCCVVALFGIQGCDETDDRSRANALAGSDALPTLTLSMIPISGMRDTLNGLERITFDSLALSRTAQLTIDSIPTTIAGGLDVEPAYDLTDAYHAALLSDGAIAVLSHRNSGVLMFSRDGKPDRIAGRRGQGPGEFSGARSMIALAADTLLLFDESNNRLNWITRDGKFAVMKSLPAGVSHGTLPLGVLPGGRLLLDGDGNSLEEIDTDTVTNSSAQLQILAIGTPRLDAGPRTIGRLPNLQLKRVETRYRGRIAHQTEFLRYGAHAVISPWKDLIVTGQGVKYHFDVRDTTGRIVQQWRVITPRRPVTQAMRDSRISLELKRMGGPRSEGMVDANESRRLAREAPFADSIPSYQRIFVSSNGTLWLVDGAAQGDTVWDATAFSRDGMMVGRIHAPGGPRIMAFGDDRVLLRVEDADGVVSMRVHRLVAAPRR